MSIDDPFGTKTGKTIDEFLTNESISMRHDADAVGVERFPEFELDCETDKRSELVTEVEVE